MADTVDPAVLERATTELGTLLAGGLASLVRPDPALDPYLDAFAVAVQRFGVGRTRMQDIAAEVGVDRTTVFRNAGSMDRLVETYLAREVHRFFDALLDDVPVGAAGVELVVEVVVRAVERARAHPVLAKAIADEPDLLARLAYANLGMLIAHVRTVVSTGLSLLAGLGLVPPVDGDVIGDWVARVGITAIVEPPADLRATLHAVLAPMFAAAEEVPSNGT